MAIDSEIRPVFHETMTKSAYINRDLSWLEFNRRVLQEAQDDTTPLLERAKFLAIVSSNLDEFMSVRAAGIMDQIKAGANREDFSGYTPPELLAGILEQSEQLVVEQYKTFHHVTGLLAKKGIHLTAFARLTPSQKQDMEHYFHSQVLPILTPMAIDQSRPFPLVRTQSLYFAVSLRHAESTRDNELYFALLQVPSNLPRVIKVSPREAGQRQFILLEDLIRAHLEILFSGYVPCAAQVFRVTRNADLPLDEEGVEDLLDEVEKKLHRRKWGTPVRLEIEHGAESSALDVLCEELQLENRNIITIEGPVDLSFLMGFASSLKGFEDLRYPPDLPVYPREFAETDDLFAVLRKQDVMVMHPFESFEAVDDFIGDAASDPAVLAIKMTLYRVSGDSHIVRSLAHAAENGKQVTVVVELKARFDEERNIAWARKLEKAGCHVVYGLVGLKIHAKMALIVRLEKDGLCRYVHVSTGNYNGKTAHIYTDIGLFTSRPEIGDDIANLFNEITGFSRSRPWHAISVAPKHLKTSIISLIQKEMEHAASGKPARIIAKVNSLSEQGLIDQLYEASRAGVKIDLIVRGICCLRPGIEGLSENITVRSIVDRYLEHSRVYYFENAGTPEVWLASADWMNRNLSRRIELMCPIPDGKLAQVVIHYLQLLLSDNVRARLLLPDGTYRRAKHEGDECRAQFEMQPILQEKYQLSAPAVKRFEPVQIIEDENEHLHEKPSLYL